MNNDVNASPQSINKRQVSDSERSLIKKRDLMCVVKTRVTTGSQNAEKKSGAAPVPVTHIATKHISSCTLAVWAPK